MLRSGLFKLMRLTLSGAEAVSHAAFHGMRSGIDWLERRHLAHQAATASGAEDAQLPAKSSADAF
jgi:hypothetical protein